jgi:hypothetical protein
VAWPRSRSPDHNRRACGGDPGVGPRVWFGRAFPAGNGADRRDGVRRDRRGRSVRPAAGHPQCVRAVRLHNLDAAPRRSRFPAVPEVPSTFPPECSPPTSAPTYAPAWSVPANAAAPRGEPAAVSPHPRRRRASAPVSPQRARRSPRKCQRHDLQPPHFAVAGDAQLSRHLGLLAGSGGAHATTGACSDRSALRPGWRPGLRSVSRYGRAPGHRSRSRYDDTARGGVDGLRDPTRAGCWHYFGLAPRHRMGGDGVRGTVAGPAAAPHRR